MTTNLHPIFQQALAPFAPPALTDEEAQAIDMAMYRDKLNDGYAKRHQAVAVHLQINDKTGAFE